jgi:hypothetical protein
LHSPLSHGKSAIWRKKKGVQLLDRFNNRVVLTEEGGLFLFDSKNLLAMCAESVATVQRMKRGENSDLTPLVRYPRNPNVTNCTNW